LAAHQKPAALARRVAALVPMPVLRAAKPLLAAATAAGVLPAPLQVRALALAQAGSMLQPQVRVRVPQRLALRAV
jgi:hypothetical protein